MKERCLDSAEKDKNLATGDEDTVPKSPVTLEEKCSQVIDSIRRDEFGVGVQLDETGQKLLKVTKLYSKDV